MSQGREPVVKRGPGRPPRHTYVAFAFKTGDLVLVKWNDGMVYFAKIKRIDHKRQKCVVVFDDKSQDEAHFSQIHSVDETTTDIICIKCKKDDSDKPNEIVLCDTCGIGFHQKCHVPNIPASALELDTPWNCSYCQKGIKCPYLTESLDVLQNLLSDDEENSIADDVESSVVLDSDLDAVNEVQQVSPRKKRGRKPAAVSLSSEAIATGKKEKRKVQASLHPQESSDVVPLGTVSSRSLSEAWKPNNEESDSDAVYLSSGRSTPEAPAYAGTKRRKHHGSPHNQTKRHKRSSVESRTVSVTRVSIPICENSSAEEMDTSRDSSASDAPPVINHGLSNIKEESGPDTRRPRILRVSLSIPDDVEPGTPFDKVVKAHQKIRSPPLGIEMKELPSWENFANSLNKSSPKERPHTLPTEKQNSILDPKAKSVSTSESPSAKEAGSSQAVSSPSAFLASPLPISSSPKLHTPVKLSVPVTNVKTSISRPSPAVGTKVATPSLICSPAAAVGYSTASLHGASFEASEIAVPNSSLVVKSSQSEVIKCNSLNQPPQRNPQLLHQPQASIPSQTVHSEQTICHGATPGITQASTSLPLSVPTKPTRLPTAAPAVSPTTNQALSHNHQQKQPAPLPVTQVQQPVLVTQSPTVPAAVTAPSKQVVASKSQLPGNSSAQQARLASPATEVRNIHPPLQLPTQQAPSRPSSVPTQQHVIVAPPSRPSSVPTQQRLLVAQSQPAQGASPTQQLLVANSHPSPNALVQQVVVVQQPQCVAKGAPATVSHTSATLPSSVAVVSGVNYTSPAMPLPRCTVQGPQQQQMVPPKTLSAKPLQSGGGGDADVIITGVESNRVTQVPSTTYQKERVTVTTAAPVSQPPGERIVLMGSSATGPGVAYHQPSAAAGKKVITQAVDLQQVVTPVSSNQAGSLVTPIGSHSPVSVVPVVITPTTELPASTQVLYQVPHPHTQPQSRGAQPTHLIRDTPVPTPPLRSVPSVRQTSQVPTSVILACSPTATSNVAQSSAASVPGPVVYSAIGPNVATFSSVNTTKPYAIVNAMPGTQIVYTASQGVPPSLAAAPVGSLPQPPKTYSHVPEKPNVGGKMHHSDVVQTISKKIGDAFDSGNEQLLVAAFEDAWKKFQANGKQYEHDHAKSLLSREGLPPNAEVFSVPGTGSRVNLVRQTSSNGANRLLTSKMTSPLSTVQQVITPPPLSSQPQTNYAHMAANAAQSQVYLQPVTVSSAAPVVQQQQQQQMNTKLQSTGLFYPPSSASSAAAKKTTAGATIQRVIVSQSAPVVRHSVNNGCSERTPEGSRKPRSTSSKAKLRFCSRCGKNATYLCSGCHAEWYCGRECQLKAWDTHADSCKA